VSKPSHKAQRVSRRSVLAWMAGGIGAVATASVAGIELVDHGVLPGKQFLNEIDGACNVASPTLSFAPLGPSSSGHFHSRARRREVGFTIAYPPGHHLGDQLPLIVMLHGFGDDHSSALSGMSPAQAVALRYSGRVTTATAMVTVDGGNGYWNPHPHDDPMGMVVDELIPMCQRRGLGAAPEQIKLMGISMGGYGALAIAERHQGLVTGVAAISPAIWTSYEEANAANQGAFASATAFNDGDVITHAQNLRGVSVRVASGVDDPFHGGVVSFAKALPDRSTVIFSSGCHDNAYFLAEEPQSVEFLSRTVVHGTPT